MSPTVPTPHCVVENWSEVLKDRPSLSPSRACPTLRSEVAEGLSFRPWSRMPGSNRLSRALLGPGQELPPRSLRARTLGGEAHRLPQPLGPAGGRQVVSAQGLACSKRSINMSTL